MRVDVVKAVGFGPFHGETLELGHGMNVIYGPNESGKSSWHAALYAALCGMRRGRGQPTRDDRAFANRHRPWSGSTWRVTAVVTLDDGRVIELDQGLGTGGRSIATDRATKKALTRDVVRDGSVDAASLLGLTRETAIATVFVRQADVLRVLTDATSLQEYLERAAATNAVDTTADEALARIAEYKRERVGVLRANARGPLATATRQLNEARAALDEAESRFESYQQLLARKRAAETELRNAETALATVHVHEQERLRRERWVEIRALRRRIEQAQSLERTLASGPREAGPGRDLVERVTRALAAFEKRPPEPAPLEGSTATALQEELNALPVMPPGDHEPATEVLSAHDQWRSEVQRLSAHEENEPTGSASLDLPAPIEEVRRLADELELATPQVDPSLPEQIERAKLASLQTAGGSPQPLGVSTATASRARIPLIAGALIAVVGMAILAVGQPVGGALALLAGVVVAGIGLARSRGQAQTRARSREPAAPISISDSTLARLEARLEVQQEAQAGVERRRSAARDRAAELGAPPDPGALRRLASEAEVAGTMQCPPRRVGATEERDSSFARKSH